MKLTKKHREGENLPMALRGAARGIEFLNMLENQYNRIDALPAQQAINDKLRRLSAQLTSQAGNISTRRAAHGAGFIAVLNLFQCTPSVGGAN